MIFFLFFISLSFFEVCHVLTFCLQDASVIRGCGSVQLCRSVWHHHLKAPQVTQRLAGTDFEEHGLLT
jgi:hypothetical protein